MAQVGTARVSGWCGAAYKINVLVHRVPTTSSRRRYREKGGRGEGESIHLHVSLSPFLPFSLSPFPPLSPSPLELTQMYITRVELENIKSHVDVAFDFERGMTAISGENGAGKTTLIEAIAWTLFEI